jgi:hypothetical protein
MTVAEGIRAPVASETAPVKLAFCATAAADARTNREKRR